MPIQKASELRDIDFLPFGIPELDDLMGSNGIPFRKIGEIFGPWSIGKSTLCYYLVISAQARGIDVLWADVERSLRGTVGYPEYLGVDVDRFPVLMEENAEDYFNEIEKWARANKNGLIVLDSVGMLRTRAEAEKESGEVSPGVRARLVDAFCRHMKPVIDMNNHALVLINHLYNPFNFGGQAGPNKKHPDIQAAGGKRLEYAKDWSLLLQKTWPKNEQGNILRLTRADGSVGGNFIKAEVWKNKVRATKGMSAVFALSVGQGVVKDWNIKDRALEKEIISREKNSYFFKGDRIAKNKAELDAWLKEEANLQKLKDALV